MPIDSPKPCLAGALYESRPDVREQLTRPEDSAVALEAMKLFISKGDEAAFEQAVALYVSSARTREESIETVPAVCCELATSLEGP